MRNRIFIYVEVPPYKILIKKAKCNFTLKEPGIRYFNQLIKLNIVMGHHFCDIPSGKDTSPEFSHEET